MSTPITFNSVAYSVPQYNDTGYAQGPGNLSSYLIAISTGTLQPSGGNFTLTADVNFGTGFGLLAKYYSSVTSNPATAGVLRLANADLVEWRNFANGGNNTLGVDSSDRLVYNGGIIPTGGSSFVSSITGTAHQIIASSATGAVTLSTPQNIDTSSTPSFAGITIGNANITLTNAANIHFQDTGVNYVSIQAPSAIGTPYGLVWPTGQGAANSFLKNDGSGNLSFAAASGNFVSSITGTANQIIASASTGAVTLSTPQDINTTSTPTWGGETISVTGTNTAKLQIGNGGANGVFSQGVIRTASIDHFRINPGSSITAAGNDGIDMDVVAGATNISMRTDGTGGAIALVGGTQGVAVDNLEPITSGTSNIGATTTPFGNIVTKGSLAFQQTGVGTTAISVIAPSSVTSHTLTLPGTQGGATTFLQNNGSGVLSWVSPTGSGTVNSGISTHLAYYATSTTAVSDAVGATISGAYTFSGIHTYSAGAGAITMSSSTIAMGANKITGLANGTAATDAAAFGQIKYLSTPSQTTNSTPFTTTSSTFQTTNLSASITPSSASSRVKITVTGGIQSNVAGTAGVFASIFRGATDLSAGNGFAHGFNAGNAGATRWPASMTYIDSPATTSSTTYSVKIRNSDNATTVSFPSSGSEQTIMILEEIV